MKKLLRRYMQYWQIGLAAALSVIAIVLSVVALTSQRDGTLDPAVEASILASGRAGGFGAGDSSDSAGPSNPSAGISDPAARPLDPGAGISDPALNTTASTTGGQSTSTGITVSGESSALAGSAPGVAPVAVFIGDGYAAGADSTAPAKRWTSLVAARLGWTEVNLGFAGTGYLTTGATRANYIGSIPDVVAANPAIVVVSGGRNDVGQPEAAEKLAITTFLNALKAAVPTARIVVLSPVWDDDPVPAGLTAIAADLQAAAATTGVGYLDIGQPLVSRTDLINDGTDPNDAGHAALADAAVAALAAAGIAG